MQIVSCDGHPGYIPLRGPAMKALKIRYESPRKQVKEILLKSIFSEETEQLMVFLNSISGFSCEIVEVEQEIKPVGDNRVMGVGC